MVIYRVATNWCSKPSELKPEDDAPEQITRVLSCCASFHDRWWIISTFLSLRALAWPTELAWFDYALNIIDTTITQKCCKKLRDRVSNKCNYIVATFLVWRKMKLQFQATVSQTTWHSAWIPQDGWCGNKPIFLPFRQVFEKRVSMGTISRGNYKTRNTKVWTAFEGWRNDQTDSNFNSMQIKSAIILYRLIYNFFITPWMKDVRR